MIYRVACLLARIRFTVGYVAALASVSTTILMHGPQVHAQVIRHASTNLHNLAHGHLGTLWNSAFVIDEGPLYFWLPCLACLLAVAELQLRSLRLTVAFVVGHIGATLLVAAVLAGAIEIGWLPWSISRVSDVGMSYGALAALGALTAAIPGPVAAGMDWLVGIAGLGDCDHRRWFHRCRPHGCVAVGHVSDCLLHPARALDTRAVCLAGGGVGVLLGAASP